MKSQIFNGLTYIKYSTYISNLKIKIKIYRSLHFKQNIIRINPKKKNPSASTHHQTYNKTKQIMGNS